MSEARRKAPAGLDMSKLDGIFAPKGAQAAGPVPVPVASPGAAPRSKAEQPGTVYLPPHKAPTVDTNSDDLIITTIRYPRHIARLMEDWLSANPGHSKTSLILNGLRSLGLAVPDEDLLPKRPRGIR